MNYLGKKNICFIDFETTGSNVFEHDPIEIGAVLINQEFHIVNEFFSTIKPRNGSKNTLTAFRIHKIKLVELENAPTSKQVINKFFKEFRVNYCFAGWNISFDVPFFRKMCYLNDMIDSYNNIDYRHIDVQTICRIARELKLIEANVRSLDDCAKYFNLTRSTTHNALEDARLTFYVYQELMKSIESSVLVDAF